jgi:hypothetical protein
MSGIRRGSFCHKEDVSLLTFKTPQEIINSTVYWRLDVGRKFWAIFGTLLLILGLYVFSNNGAWASLAPGILVLVMAAFSKDSEL